MFIKINKNKNKKNHYYYHHPTRQKARQLCESIRLHMSLWIVSRAMQAIERNARQEYHLDGV